MHEIFRFLFLYNYRPAIIPCNTIIVPDALPRGDNKDKSLNKDTKK